MFLLYSQISLPNTTTRIQQINKRNNKLRVSTKQRPSMLELRKQGWAAQTIRSGLIIGRNRLKYTCHQCTMSQPNLFGIQTMVNSVNTMRNGHKMNKLSKSELSPSQTYLLCYCKLYCSRIKYLVVSSEIWVRSVFSITIVIESINMVRCKAEMVFRCFDKNRDYFESVGIFYCKK